MSEGAVVIGAGPIGLETAVALLHAGVSCRVVESGVIGATIAWWAPGTRFFSSPDRIAIAGVPLQTPNQDKATREEYLAYLRGVARQFGVEIDTRTTVTALTARGAGFEIAADSWSGPRRYEARWVVAAIGGMHRPRLLGVPGEDLPHVSHYFRDPHEYAGRRVVIVGGRNSAVEAALRLVRVGAHVTMCHRREVIDESRIKYWLWPEFASLVKTRRIVFHAGTTVARIDPGETTLRERDGGWLVVPTDDVLALIGYEMDGSLLASAGVEFHGTERAPVFDRHTMETNVPGLFVAGTATAGTQSQFRVFIENCHTHAPRIVAAITGSGALVDGGGERTSRTAAWWHADAEDDDETRPPES